MRHPLQGGESQQPQREAEERKVLLPRPNSRQYSGILNFESTSGDPTAGHADRGDSLTPDR